MIGQSKNAAKKVIESVITHDGTINDLRQKLNDISEKLDLQVSTVAERSELEATEAFVRQQITKCERQRDALVSRLGVNEKVSLGELRRSHFVKLRIEAWSKLARIRHRMLGRRFRSTAPKQIVSSVVMSVSAGLTDICCRKEITLPYQHRCGEAAG